MCFWGFLTHLRFQRKFGLRAQHVTSVYWLTLTTLSPKHLQSAQISQQLVMSHDPATSLSILFPLAQISMAAGTVVLGNLFHSKNFKVLCWRMNSQHFFANTHISSVFIALCHQSLKEAHQQVDCSYQRPTLS